LVLAVLVGLVSVGPVLGQADDFEREPINYSKATPDNRVTHLQQRLDSGQAKLEYDRRFGYLRSLLKELQVPESSQMLVFSKTSLQRQRISPRTPRGIYFNDEVYVGYCQHGEVLEVSAVDPKLGTVFYTLEQTQAEKPRFQRHTDNCMLCHASTQTYRVPGHINRSVFSDAEGYPILSAGSYRIDHTSPLKDRWGSWYVTGTHGEQTHLGNLVIHGKRVVGPIEDTSGLNRTCLDELCDCSPYPSKHSDIVALMVLEHQADGHNLLTRASFAGWQALHYEQTLNRELKLPASNRWDSTLSRVRSAADPLVKYLLFCDEAPLTGKVQGTSGFAEEFARQGRRDAKGRSLRDFDLEKRLFKYPCSYLIYSPSFDAMPGMVREYVLQRLWDVLSGKDQSKDFAHLSPADRQAIREVLAATMKDLPACWQTTVSSR
jgi:hypothetical protein